MTQFTEKFLKRFWSKVKKTDECWEWIKGTYKGGYGSVWFNGKARAAHRIVWEYCISAIPEWADVCHYCDNPKCVRPDHLFLGDQTKNNKDRDMKGRMSRKLQDEDVRQIRASIGTYQAIADKFGVSNGLVSMIKNGQIWRYI